MEKSRLLILCSSRTVVLAEQLQAGLKTDFCEATLWSEDGGIQTSGTIIETLEEQFDFTVVLLAGDDVSTRDGGDRISTRDSFIFSTGLCLAAFGAERCFLVVSVAQGDLPTPLRGIILLPFEEPADLTDQAACAAAITSPVLALIERVQRKGRYPYHVPVSSLSLPELMERERPRSAGGDLLEGQVLVCDTQPMADEKLAVQLRHNLDNGISYLFFFFYSRDCIEKICQSLQVILAAGVVSPERALDFNTRMQTIKENKNQILADLDRICRSRQLRIAVMRDEPQFIFRIHNASHREQAALYVRYGERCFIPWARGLLAESIWRRAPRYFEQEGSEHLFIELKLLGLDEGIKRDFEQALTHSLGRYFPGSEREVMQICAGAPA